jgi:hypothetical protein
LLGLTPAHVPNRDYIQYWAAGKQLVHHANPYDVQQIFLIERRAGIKRNEPYVSLSPPVALEFALPLGLLSAKTGLIIWEIAQLASIAISTWLLWRMFGKPDSRFHLLGFGFAPVIACAMAGQLGTFFLLCFVLFLHLHYKRPFFAGVILMPFALKPHLFVPFLVTIVVFCLIRRQFSILVGAASGLAASCAVSLLIDPRAWAEYRAMTSSVQIMDAFVPTLGMTLRFVLARSATWIDFIPVVLGCAWAGWYSWSRSSRWNWLEDGSLVLMVSVVCAPYAWVFDQPLLFPAILSAIYRSQKSILLLLILALMQVGSLVQLQFQPHTTSVSYLWTAPGWLAWYLCAKHLASSRQVHQIQRSALS